MADEKANKNEKVDKPAGGTNSGGSPAHSQPAQPMAQPSQPPQVNLAGLSAKELLSALDGLKPEQLLVVRQAAVAAGIAPPVKESGDGVTLPDGRVKVTVIFDPDLGAQLKLWSEAQNESLAKFIESALTSYVQMDWSSAGDPAAVAAK